MEIKQMKLEEKVAQLQGIWLNELVEGEAISIEKCKEKIPYGIGHVCQLGSGHTFAPDVLAKLVYDVQQFVLTQTDSKIPVLFHEEVIDGLAVRGATVTPQMLGMACSFRPSLVKRNAENSAATLKSLGGYYALSPMMDIITDARWARGEEGFGEDSYLVSAFADSFITGLQGAGVGATAKHYAGYGVENQENSFFLNETLAPFEVAVAKSGVKGIMPGYHKFRGVPSTCSSELLAQSLRGHLNFKGLIVSDYGAITNIHKNFGYTKGACESAVLAMGAGVDVDFPKGENYQYLVQAVRDGAMDEAQVDAAVERVLALKKELLPDEITLASHIELDPEAHRQAALESAREAIVMLKNDGVLPLATQKDRKTKLLVTGPNADSYYSLVGDYTWIGLSEFFYGNAGDKLNPRLVTLLDGLRNATASDDAGFEVEYERGFAWVEAEEASIAGKGGDARANKANRRPLEPQPIADFEAALQKAASSDVIIAAVGENRYLCGESTVRDMVTLPGAQEAYVEQLLATGKPVVLCVFGGRPMAIASLAKRCAAVLYAWYPGEEGGTACTEILLGKTNPTAKLAVTLPDTCADVPVCLRNQEKHMVFPFGFGLSYTQYRYDDFAFEPNVSTAQAYFELTYTVENIGARDGAEITQFYCIDAKTNCKKVIGFTKTDLQQGAKKQVRMRFYLDQFGKYEDDGFVVSAGEYQFVVGSDSETNEYVSVLSIEGAPVKKQKRTEFFAVEV